MNCQVLNKIDKMEEECGVFGLYSPVEKEISTLMYYGLYALQHRGQESSGMSVSKEGKIKTHKNMGITPNVFNDKILAELQGNAAIGHVRYSTCGDSNVENAQPLSNHTKLGDVAIAHNGTLVNSHALKDLLEETGATFNTTIDSEVILKLISRKAIHGLEKAVVDTVNLIQGAYALVILVDNKLIGVRDPFGIRPLCLGQMEDGTYILTSESCGIDAVGGKIVRDIKPGEMVVIDEDGIKSIQYAESTNEAPCSFEYIYFARPDSRIDGISVYEARHKGGKKLYEQQPVEADLVIGVPDSGIPAAIGYAEASGIPYGVGFIKNKYVARTFIAPTQELREKAVSVKLNVIRENIEGKRIVVIDDSVVRGTTSKRLVDLLKNAGAKEVHFRSASPAVKFPCYFGIDTAHRSELIASKMSVEEVCEMIGADSLGFLSIDNLVDTLEGKKYCLGCFNGKYPVYAPMGND
jgi:amidophosphoribosyltransferase